MIEYVDVLSPPDFCPSGRVLPVLEAIEAGYWLGVMNLWLVRPNGSVIYQLRPPGGWEPNKFDGSVGGYYRAGESGLDGLREAEEELGWRCSPDEVSLLGRHLSVGVDSRGRERRLVVTVFMSLCSTPLAEFALDPDEVPALFEIAADDVVTAIEQPGYTFETHGIDCSGRLISRQASAAALSYVFGGYHLKIAQIARRYAAGERRFSY